MRRAIALLASCGILLALMLGAVQPAAAAVTWTQYDDTVACGCSNFGTWSASGAGFSYAAAGGSNYGGIAFYVASATVNTFGASVNGSSTLYNVGVGLVNGAGDGLYVALAGGGTTASLNLNEVVNYGNVTYATNYSSMAAGSAAMPQRLSISYDSTTPSMTVSEYSSGGSLLVSKTETYAGLWDSASGPFHPVVGSNQVDVATVGSTSLSAPPVPTGLQATGGNMQASLSWSAVSSAASYDVLQSASQGGTYATVASGVSGTSAVISGLTNGTTQWFAVAACNAYGCSTPSSPVSATPEPDYPPTPPYDLLAQPGDHQVGLLWQSVAGATNYNVEYGTTSGGPWILAAQPVATVYTVLHLTNLQQYWFRVQSVNQYGGSIWANPVEAVPDPATIVAGVFVLPSLADAGLWGAVAGFFGHFWPAFVLAIALIIFSGFGPALVGLLRQGAERVRQL